MRPFATCVFSAVSTLFATFALLFATLSAQAQITRYVSTTGTTDPGSATTWASSTTDLQGAIDASAAGDQVWVATGTYKPGGSANLDKTLSFALKNGVTVLGGFPAAGSPTLAQRNPRTHLTTLSGDLDNDGTLAGNSYHIFFLPGSLGLNASAQLDGFELTGGNAANLALINTEIQAVQGGAVYIESGSPVFQNCVFRGNSAGGCGIYGCYGYGGAISNDGGSPGFINCTFTGNSAFGSGGQGGVVYSSNGSPGFTNCSFQGNSAGSAGGVFYESNTPIRFMNCSFQGNSSVNDGFVGVTNSMNYPNNGATITNSVFWNNGGSRAFTYYDAAQPVLSHSLLEAWSDVVFGPGIRYAPTSPFASTTATSLNPCSEAIGNADVTSYTALFGSLAASPQTDERGNARFRSGVLDMGARQYDGALTDLLILVSQPPASTVVTVNAAVTATYSVTSAGAVSFQWYKDNAPVAGQTSGTLSLSSAAFADAGRYVAVASSTGGCSLTSTAFQLNVVPIYSLTVNIAANPSLTVTQGATTTLTASGASSYVWSTGFVGNPLIVPVNTTTIFSVSGLTGINGGIASVTVTTVPVACRPIIYVTETGTGAQTGADWNNAIAGRNMQQAINAAQGCGGQVWVASGTYKPTQDANRAISFSMKPGVAIYGGFVGNETSLSQRPVLNPNSTEGRPGQPSSSTLSGDIGTVGTSVDNSFHVIYNNPGLAASAILDGFVVTGGQADVFGGGMFNNGVGAGQVCSPTVRNCSFIDNRAIYGGGVWNQGSNGGTSSPRFENTYFERNVATALGGAFYNQPDPNGTTSGTLVNCGFASNSAPDGGAVYNNGYGGGRAFPLFVNCAFINNTATRGAAIFNIGFTNGRAVPTVINGSFQGNTATGSGGAIFNNPISGTAGTYLTNSVFWGNGGDTSITPASTFTANTSLLEASVPGGVPPNGTGNLVAGTSPFSGTGVVALNPCAPAIGTGDVAAYNAANGPGTDWVGNARFRNGVLDMGAQQFVGTLSALVTITSQPPTSLTVNAGDDLSVPVSATSGGALTYQWYKGGAVLTGQTSATLSIPDAQTIDSGTYVVSVSATGGCSTTSTALQLTVAPSDRPVLAITVTPSAIVTAGVTVTLTASGATSYTWANGTQGNTLVFTPTATTVISVTGTNALGFTGTRSVTVTVTAIPCQSVLYVTPNGAGAQTGNGWSNAVAGRNLQLAINAGVSCGAQVWVAAGTYRPTQDGNRVISFNMQPGVKIYGGFVGNETSLSQRPALNPTLGQVSSSTLSGEIGDPNSTTDNSYHVLLNGNGITNADILDGFVVRDGYAADAGGGMYNNANQITLSTARWVCSPTIRNVLFTNNFAPLGGAIYNDSRVQGRTNPYLENTAFVSNTAVLGGAIMNHTFNYGNANWRAINCRFERNWAQQGGALYSNGDAGGEANFVVVNGVFVSNTATQGGVAYNYARLIGVVSPSFVNCSFWGNSGVNFNDQSVPNGFTPGTTLPVFNNSVFWNNGGANTLVALGQAPLVYNSALEPGTNGFNGTGNVFETSNPFSSSTSLQLNPCAQAIDLADPNAYTLAGGPATDAAGQPRPFGSGLDAGAVEWQTPASVTATLTASSTVVCVGQSVTLTATGAGGTSPYQYNFGTGSSATGTTVVAPPLGTNPYSVTVTDANGCRATAQTSVSAVTSPAVSLSASGTLTCAVTSVTLTATASGVTGYRLSDGQTNSTGTFVVSAAGTYTVTVSGVGGCTGTAVTTVESNTTAPTNVGLTAVPSGTLTCAVTSVTLTSSATGIGLGYSFAGPSGTLVSVGSSATVNAPGTYTVTVSGNNGCTASASATVFLNTTLPPASLTTASGALTFCTGTSLTIVAGTGIAYQFSNGATQIDGSSGNTATINSSGTYSVTVTGANGCTGTASISVSTVAATTITNALPASVSVCEGGTPSALTVTATGANLTYQWYKNSSALPGKTTNVLTLTAANPADAGNYYAIVSGSCGSVSSSTMVLSVRARPAAPALAPVSRTVVAAPAPATVSLVQYVIAAGTLSFSNTSGVLNPPNVSIASAGVFSFSVAQTDGFGCVSPATPFSLTVISPLPPTSQSTCRGSNVVLNVLPNGTHYQWFRHASPIAPGARLTDVASLYRGTTTASLTLVSTQTTGHYSCQVTQANGTVQTFGPFAVNVTLCGSREAAAEPTLAVQVRVAPNPLADNLLRATITGAGGQRLTVMLIDQQGRVVQEQQWQQADEQQRIEWHVGTFPTGTMLLQAVTDRQRQIVKVVKQ